jgi:hypothetical protein
MGLCEPIEPVASSKGAREVVKHTSQARASCSKPNAASVSSDSDMSPSKSKMKAAVATRTSEGGTLKQAVEPNGRAAAEARRPSRQPVRVLTMD